MEEPPAGTSHLWSLFLVLARTRSAGFSMVNPITYQEMQAYAELTGTHMDAFRIEIVKRLENLQRRVAREQKEARDG